MIRVTVELDPAWGGPTETLGVLTIANEGPVAAPSVTEDAKNASDPGGERWYSVSLDGEHMAMIRHWRSDGWASLVAKAVEAVRWHVKVGL